MKIIKLTAENVKRLKAVEITPDGTMQVITGRNAQGKTSVLDAIWLALGGGAAGRETPRPIRDGADTASVRLDLGDLVVTRTWTGEKTALTVKTADGAGYNSPQAVLDALVGRLSFDPLEFTRLSARDQRAALLDLVDLDVDLPALAARRQKFYDARTEIGRTVKQLEGQVKGLGPVEKAPAEEQSASALLAEVRAVQQEAERQAGDRRAVAEHTAEVARYQEALDRARHSLADAEAAVAGHRPLPDAAQLEEKLAQLEDTNRAVRRNADRAQFTERLTEARELYARHTAAIDEIDRAKADALAKADFPVEGLAFDDSGVTYNGIPFAQASAAEQIRVSLAMAMSLNPKLRVIRILDGSLLDEDNLKLIADLAAERDYQIWVERVADGSNVGVVIEDGLVAS